MSENYSIAEIGKRLPFPILPADGATFAIGPDGFKLIMQLSRPKASEIRAVLRDRVDIAVMTIGSTAIIVWRFLSSASGQVPLIFDTPFHIGLLASKDRYIPDRRDGEAFLVPLFLQDEFGVFRGGRMVGLGPFTSTAIELAVARQAAEASRPGWSRGSHDQEVEAFYRRYPDVENAWMAAGGRRPGARLVSSPLRSGGTGGRSTQAARKCKGSSIYTSMPIVSPVDMS